jgi:hypothetical protein
VPAAIVIYIRFDYYLPLPYYMVIILAASNLVIGPVIFTIIAGHLDIEPWAGRIHYTLVTMALLGMV